MKEYERLTTKDKNGNWQVWEDDYSHPFEALQTAIDKLAELEDKIERGELVENTVVTYVNMGRSDSKTLIDKALKYAELEDKIENGTLIELPCKVGDTVWFVYETDNETMFIDKGVIQSFSYDEQGVWFRAIYENLSSYWHTALSIGDTVFLAKAEAEKKLKELQGE